MSAACGGCGRRVGAAEVACGACGRPTGGGASPEGWTTATVGVEPAPPTPLDAIADEDVDVAALFLPAHARPGTVTPEDGHGGADGAGGKDGEDEDRSHQGETAGTVPPRREPPAAAAPDGIVSPGWRVRLSTRQAEALVATEAEATPVGSAAAAVATGPPSAPAPLPGWVYPVLVGAILVTSVVAAVLIVVHVLRTS